MSRSTSDTGSPTACGNAPSPMPAGSSTSAGERSPEIDYYNDEYLVLLTADTVKETAFSDYTLAACEALMAARGQ